MSAFSIAKVFERDKKPSWKPRWIKFIHLHPQAKWEPGENWDIGKYNMPQAGNNFAVICIYTKMKRHRK